MTQPANDTISSSDSSESEPHVQATPTSGSGVAVGAGSNGTPGRVPGASTDRSEIGSPTSGLAPAQTPHKAPAKRAKFSRDPWPDNLRMLAAIVICSFHFSDQFRQSGDSFTLLWYMLWGARVPVFVLIAGYFSPARYTRKMFVSLIRSVIGVFLIFTLFHALINVAFGKDFVFNLLEPYLGLWFLVSLLLWRLTLPLILKIPGYFVWALVAAIAFGMCQELISQWPITRTFSYLPMFVVGHWLRTRPDFRDLLSTTKFRIIAVAIILASWVVFALTYTNLHGPQWNMKWAYRGDLSDLGVLLPAMAQRLGIICFGIVFALCVIALIPRTKVPFLTVLGAGSFYVYLLHPLVLRVLNNLDFFDHVNTRAEKLAVFVGAALLAILLATPPVRKVFRPLVQPKYHVPFLSERRRASTAESVIAVNAGAPAKSVDAADTARSVESAPALAPVSAPALGPSGGDKPTTGAELPR